jgi:hypothetical protein
VWRKCHSCWWFPVEEDIVALAGMAEDDCYREMLVERLGLSNWGLIEGGSPEPA